VLDILYSLCKILARFSISNRRYYHSYNRPWVGQKSELRSYICSPFVDQSTPN